MILPFTIDKKHAITAVGSDGTDELCIGDVLVSIDGKTADAKKYSGDVKKISKIVDLAQSTHIFTFERLPMELNAGEAVVHPPPPPPKSSPLLAATSSAAPAPTAAVVQSAQSTKHLAPMTAPAAAPATNSRFSISSTPGPCMSSAASSQRRPGVFAVSGWSQSANMFKAVCEATCDDVLSSDLPSAVEIKYIKKVDMPSRDTLVDFRMAPLGDTQRLDALLLFFRNHDRVGQLKLAGGGALFLVEGDNKSLVFLRTPMPASAAPVIAPVHSADSQPTTVANVMPASATSIALTTDAQLITTPAITGTGTGTPSPATAAAPQFPPMPIIAAPATAVTNASATPLVLGASSAAPTSATALEHVRTSKDAPPKAAAAPAPASPASTEVIQSELPATPLPAIASLQPRVTAACDSSGSGAVSSASAPTALKPSPVPQASASASSTAAVSAPSQAGMHVPLARLGVPPLAQGQSVPSSALVSPPPSVAPTPSVSALTSAAAEGPSVAPPAEATNATGELLTTGSRPATRAQPSPKPKPAGIPDAVPEEPEPKANAGTGKLEPVKTAYRPSGAAVMPSPKQMPRPSASVDSSSGSSKSYTTPVAPSRPSNVATLPLGGNVPRTLPTSSQSGRERETAPPSAIRTGARTERIRGSQYVLNEGVSIGVHQRPASIMDRTPEPLPFGGVFSFFVPDSARSPSSRPGSPKSPGKAKTAEELLKLEDIEKAHQVSVSYVTPRGETAIKSGGAKALTAFFDQFCELSA